LGHRRTFALAHVLYRRNRTSSNGSSITLQPGCLLAGRPIASNSRCRCLCAHKSSGRPIGVVGGGIRPMPTSTALSACDVPLEVPKSQSSRTSRFASAYALETPQPIALHISMNLFLATPSGAKSFNGECPEISWSRDGWSSTYLTTTRITWPCEA
jgi:hypothetical protein